MSYSEIITNSYGLCQHEFQLDVCEFIDGQPIV